MEGRYLDLIGTVFSRIRLGLVGPWLKDESGQIATRNPADDDYVALRTALVRVFGDDIELNAGAAGSGADRTMTLRRPDTGMSQDITIVMPAGSPAPGQALTVASFGSGVVVLEYSSIASGADKIILETTTVDFNSSSPVTMFTKPANAIVDRVKVVIDESYDGTPSLSVGIGGSPSKYMGSNQVDLTKAATTVFEVDPGEPAVGTTEDLIATLAAGGATVGSARVIVAYCIPS